MKIHTTNYFNTFIEVAEDTKRKISSKPPVRDKRTVAEIQYDLISSNPYKYTSDDILFQIFADRNNLTKSEYKKAREHFFSKGQACLRASPLTRTYGYGIHFDDDGKIALYGMETPEYQNYVSDKNIKKIKAIRLKR
jgi:hypothetical protein